MRHQKLGLGMWTWLGIAIVITVIGTGVTWLLRADLAYAPFAGALVSGTATLIGVYMGLLALKANYLSQANPLRLELYKKRAEGLTLLYEKVVELWWTPLSRPKTGES